MQFNTAFTVILGPSTKVWQKVHTFSHLYELDYTHQVENIWQTPYLSKAWGKLFGAYNFLIWYKIHQTHCIPHCNAEHPCIIYGSCLPNHPWPTWMPYSIHVTQTTNLSWPYSTWWACSARPQISNDLCSHPTLVILDIPKFQPEYCRNYTTRGSISTTLLGRGATPPLFSSRRCSPTMIQVGRISG